MMKIVYDAEVDALSIIFKETTVQTKHLAEGISAELDADGQVVGIEILDASKRLGKNFNSEKVEILGLKAA